MKSVASLTLIAALFFSCNTEGPRISFKNVSELETLFEGSVLTLYTSGREIKTGRHKKSGVWDVPSRKQFEMWVQREDSSEAIRLNPFSFQKQLTKLLADIPEVHGFIEQKDLTYQTLPTAVELLDEHIDRVLLIRKERRLLPAVEVLK